MLFIVDQVIIWQNERKGNKSASRGLERWWSGNLRVNVQRSEELVRGRERGDNMLVMRAETK